MILKDRVAIVTGASREIGAAMALELAAAGAAIVVGHYAEPELAAQTVARIAGQGGRAIAVDADGRRVADAQKLVDAAVSHFGRLDIAAANAGITRFGAPTEFNEATFDDVVDTNLKGSFFLAQAAARQMQRQPNDGYGGRIVFSSSVVSLVGVPVLAAYGMTKAALNYLAGALAVAFGPSGITVNSIAIGATVNARNLADDPAYAENFAKVLPIGRVLHPADAAAALLYLASPAASGVNGATLVVDGGHHLTVAASRSSQTGSHI